MSRLRRYLLLFCIVGLLNTQARSKIFDEYTFDRAIENWQLPRRGVIHIGIPGYQWQAGVFWDGSLLFGPTNSLRNVSAVSKECIELGDNQAHVSFAYGSPMRFIDRRGNANPVIKRSFFDNLFPIPEISFIQDGIRYEQTVFANFLDNPPEYGMVKSEGTDTLITCSKFEVSNPSSKKRSSSVWIYFGDLAHTRYFYKTVVDEKIDNSLAHRFEAPFGYLDIKKNDTLLEKSLWDNRSVTITGWIKDNGQQSEGTIFACWPNWKVVYDSNSQSVSFISLKNGNENKPTSSKTSFDNLNKWHFFAVTVDTDSNEVQVFYGDKDSPTELAGRHAYSDGIMTHHEKYGAILTLGSELTGGNSHIFRGMLDELRIWSKSKTILTADEIELVRQYDLNEKPDKTFEFINKANIYFSFEGETGFGQDNECWKNRGVSGYGEGPSFIEDNNQLKYPGITTDGFKGNAYDGSNINKDETANSYDYGRRGTDIETSESEKNIRYVLPSPDKGTIQWHESITACDGYTSPNMEVKKVIEWQTGLEPGQKATLYLMVPYGLVDKNDGQKIAELQPEEEFREICEYWRGIIASKSGKINTADKWFTNYTDTVTGHMLNKVAYRQNSDLWMYKTQQNCYELNWVVCGAKALPSLDLLGLTDFSRPILQSYIDYQSDDIGNMDRKKMGHGEKLGGEGFAKYPGYLGNFKEWLGNPIIWGHGLVLWDLAGHYRITRDKQWLGEGEGSPLLAILDGCEWLKVQRARTKFEKDGKKISYWGLLPPASVHDWLAGSVIINDAYCIQGMAESVRLLREIGHPRYEEFASELADYRQCLKQNYILARDSAKPMILEDGSAIPFVPRSTEELDWKKIDWTYTSYGPGRAGAVGAIEPDDELIDQFISFLEAGFPKCHNLIDPRNDSAEQSWYDVSAFAPENSPRTNIWRHYIDYEINWPMTNLFLQRDDLPRFFECFFNSFAIIDRSWMIGAESIDGVPGCSPGEAVRWSAIRNMFVNEIGGYDGSQQELFLLQAIPKEWLKAGEHLSAKDMRTYFGGKIDIDINIAENGMSLEVALEIDVAVKPSRILVRLRSQHGGDLISAKVNKKQVQVIDSDIIELKQEKKSFFSIEAAFE